MLDSVVEADGPDPFYRPTLEAVPRVLRSLCRAGCRSFTSDPVADLARLVRRMGAARAARARRGPARAPAPGARSPAASCS